MSKKPSKTEPCSLRKLIIDGGGLEAEYVGTKALFAGLIASFKAMCGSANYVAVEVQSGGEWFEVIVRPRNKPTDHQLRKAAEQRVTELETELARYRTVKEAANP